MNWSMYTADRSTHLKIVWVGFAAALLIAVMGIAVQMLNLRTDIMTAQDPTVVKAGRSWSLLTAVVRSFDKLAAASARNRAQKSNELQVTRAPPSPNQPLSNPRPPVSPTGGLSFCAQNQQTRFADGRFDVDPMRLLLVTIRLHSALNYRPPAPQTFAPLAHHLDEIVPMQ